jgi:hypothetical protein
LTVDDVEVANIQGAMSNVQRPSDDVSSVDDIDFMDKNSERCEMDSVIPQLFVTIYQDM